MAMGAFGDRAHRPLPEDLARELGRSWAAWEHLTSWLSERFTPLTEEWAFVGEQWGWSLRLKHKKRRVLYVLPLGKSFQASVVLGEKAVERALTSGLPGPVEKALREATRYPEGRVVRLQVRSKKDLVALKTLVEAKMAK